MAGWRSWDSLACIDLGSKESQVCVRTSTGDIVEERRCGTNELEGWLSSRAPGRVIVETCTEAFRVADMARRHGHEVRVVAATPVRALGVGRRGLKNDVRDARLLCSGPTPIHHKAGPVE